MKKRKLKWQVKFVLFIIALIVYSFTLGTKGIFIKEYKIETNNINKKLDGIKILQFSDLLFGSSTKRNTVKELIKKINLAKPDIIIFSGGILNNNYDIMGNDENFLINELSKTKAEVGKYYITGNKNDKKYEDILIKSGFISLDNNYEQLYQSISNPIVILSKKNTNNYLSNNADFNGFKILVLNNPKDFDDYKNNNFDMVISGYTLNGQIYIPKLNKYIINSKYYKSYQKINNTKLYINNGIGTKHLPARLFNHPTINLYRIYKK